MRHRSVKRLLLLLLLLKCRCGNVVGDAGIHAVGVKLGLGRVIGPVNLSSSAWRLVSRSITTPPAGGKGEGGRRTHGGQVVVSY